MTDWLDWGKFVIPMAVSALGLFISFRKSQRTELTGSIDSVIKANTDFRKEMKDRLDEAMKENQILFTERRDCEGRYLELNQQHKLLRCEFDEHKLVCVIYTNRIK